MSETGHPRTVLGWTVEQQDESNFTARHPDGRTMRVRVPDFVDTLDLTEAIATVDDPFGKFQRLAMVAFAVHELDGVPVPRPKTKNALREAGKQLGNERFAVAAMILFPPAVPSVEAPPDETALIAKN